MEMKEKLARTGIAGVFIMALTILLAILCKIKYGFELPEYVIKALLSLGAIGTVLVAYAIIRLTIIDMREALDKSKGG
jgi:hypothetical protein